MEEDSEAAVLHKLKNMLAATVEPVTLEKPDYRSLLDKIGNARFVLMGEATHGTHEFYQTRIELTQQLIEEKGFMAVAIEGDWPDVYQVHRYLQGAHAFEETEAALKDFKRFPVWMWRNSTLPPFLKRLRAYNDSLPAHEKIGFYGLDLYSLHTSMQAVINYLAEQDPAACERARLRYNCFEEIKLDPQTYGYLTTQGVKQPCSKEVIEQLLELQQHAFDYVHQDNKGNEDNYFYAMQNARLVKNAENYYRAMFENSTLSWNVRDRHMAETLNTLANHLEKKFKRPAKIIIWAHNSHVGDARATEMGERGEVNIGQLVREQYPNETYVLGFSTYQGFVTAADDWDGPVTRKPINPGVQGSYEALFHELPYPNFLLDLKQAPDLNHYLKLPRLQRAIGVIYRPHTERSSHYFFTRLPYQFDALLHFDRTEAVQPLDSKGS